MKHNRRYISWLIISLYAAIYIGWDMLHAQIHQDAATLHTIQVEKDACHRSVFHGEKDTHKSHLTSYKHCASCHVVSQPPTFGEPPVVMNNYPVVSETGRAISVLKAQRAESLFSSRAPPAMV